MCGAMGESKRKLKGVEEMREAERRIERRKGGMGEGKKKDVAMKGSGSRDVRRRKGGWYG